MSEDLKAAISANGEYRVDRAHNELLQVGATTGLLGLAAYLWIFISYFRNVYRRSGWPLIALSGAVLAYFLQLQTVFSTIDTGVAFWSILGTSVALMRIHDQEQLEEGEQERGEGPNPKTPRQTTLGSVRGALISGVPKKRGTYYELGVVVVVVGVLAAIAIPTSLELRERVAQIERLALMGDVTQTVSAYERAKEQGGTYPKAGAYTASYPLEADGIKIPTNHNVRITITTTPAGGFEVEGESTTLSGTFRYGYDSATGYTSPP
jgi:type II secretory pathway pseudopilin PulG